MRINISIKSYTGPVFLRLILSEFLSVPIQRNQCDHCRHESGVSFAGNEHRTVYLDTQYCIPR